MAEWTVRAFAPGRTELAGNHLDHQGGLVVAAAVEQGIEVLARPNGRGTACVRSRGFMPFEIAIAGEGDLAPRLEEAGTSAGLVRGMVAGLRAAGDVRYTMLVSVSSLEGSRQYLVMPSTSIEASGSISLPSLSYLPMPMPSSLNR